MTEFNSLASPSLGVMALWEHQKQRAPDQPSWMRAHFSYKEPKAAAGGVHWELPKREPFLNYERAHTRTHSTSQSIAFPGAESVLSAPRQYISLWPASDFTER